MTSTFKPVRQRFKLTRKRVVMFLLMFAIFVLLIIGILVTLWYTFSEKSGPRGEAPAYVANAFLNLKGSC